MMKAMFVLSAVLHSLIVSFISNSFAFIRQYPESLFVIVPFLLLTNLFAGTFVVNTKRSKICLHGTIFTVRLLCFNDS